MDKKLLDEAEAAAKRVNAKLEFGIDPLYIKWRKSPLTAVITLGVVATLVGIGVLACKFGLI